MAKTPTNRELQDLLDEIGSKSTQMLDPTLNRKELVLLAQEIDEVINGPEKEEEDDDEEEDDE